MKPNLMLDSESNESRGVEERLRKSEQYYKSIIEDMADVTSILKPDGTFLYVSGSVGAATSVGVKPEALVGRNTLEFIHPDDRQKVRAGITQALEGTPKTIEARVIKPDGTWMEVEIRGKAMFDPDGNQVVVASSRNITDRKSVERERAMLAAIVSASQDAIIGFSQEDKIIYWNAGAERTYGYSARETIGQGFELFVPLDQQRIGIEGRRRLFATGGPVCWEERARRRDGHWFVSSISIFPIRDTEGNIIGGASIGREITHLKEIERELREAHDYTRGLIESWVDAMVVVDKQMLITDCNERLARLTEVPKKTLLSSPFDSYFADRSTARSAIEKTFVDGWVANVDLLLKSASGKETPVSFSASLFYSAGKVLGIFGVARDVTQQRATEGRLREQREYSRRLVQSSPDALLVCDSELALTDANDEASALTGYSRDELLGISLLSLFTEPDLASEQITKARQQERVHDVELQLLTKSAGAVPVSLNLSAFRNDDTDNGRVIASLRDMSDIKRAERERSLLAAIVDSSGDAIYSESRDLTLTSWNPAAETLYGYSSAEILGRSAALLVPLDRRAELMEYARKIRGTGTAQNFESKRLRRDGIVIDVAITQSPILDAAGTVTGMSVTARDIGDRKRMEAELAQARDAALEAARVKSEFLANMSHEIRTPINSIIGLTGLLLDTPLNPEQLEFVHDVRTSGDALLSLINNILDFSKMAAGKLVFQATDFELTKAVEEAAELISDQARRKGLEVTVAIDPDVPRLLHGDAGRLGQVLLNLLSNAVKFTAHGEVNVTVSKLSENPREAVLRFEVHDTGIGIAKDKQQLLFKPFTQIDGSTTRPYAGSGLGLSIVRALVEAMHGTISLSSRLGEGSTFWFAVTLQKQVDRGLPASARFAALTGTRILIVDDNATSRRILENEATSWGLRTSTASSVEEGLRMLRAAQDDRYQLALLDVTMPEIGGIEMARRMKSDPRLAQIPVIMLSSAGGSSDFNVRMGELKVAAWLTKPVPESTLYDGLVSVLAPSPGADVGNSERRETKVVSPRFKLPAEFNSRVLLAEDNPINQKVAKLQLQKLGLEVDAVANGREALDAISAHPYDLIVMDCQMPELDGYEVTRELRRREGDLRHATIVAMTAYALPDDREKCLAAGMDAYMSKPVTLAALEDALCELFPADSPGASRGRAAGLPSPPTLQPSAPALPATAPPKPLLETLTAGVTGLADGPAATGEDAGGDAADSRN
jgi:two-component system sensor histidine kinase/response regulator